MKTINFIKYFKKLIVPLVFFALTLTVLINWFGDGLLMGGGEEGFSIFNHRSVFSQIDLWQEVGTGYLMPAYITRLAPIIFVSILRFVKLPIITTQAIFYFVMIYSGLIGFYIFSNEVFKNSKRVKFISFFSSTFYFFNLYSQSQVFGRFLYSSIALWSLTPIFLFCFIKWMETLKLKWLVCLVFVSNIYSLAFSQPAHVLALWAPLFIWVFVKIIEVKKNRSSVIRTFLVAFISWIVFSLWWIYPYFKLGTLAFGQKLSISSNLSSLQGVSQYFPTKEIILLRQSFLFGPSSNIYEFYSSNLIYFISIVVFILFVVGIVKLEKNKNRLFILVTLFVGWFVSKGSNPPLGKVFFEFLFSNFGFTQSLRNSYEKFGLVFLIAYALLYGVGLSFVTSKFKNLFSRMFFVFVIISVSCVVLVWPMWNGNLFTKSLHVKIPIYYEQANVYLNTIKNDGRILHLPIIGGDTVGYKWGYRGVDPAEFLFDKPSVSKILRDKYFDDKYLALYSNFTGKKDYSKQLGEMNVRYLVLHEDLVPEVSGASSSAEVKETLSQNSKIRELKNFGELTVYEYVDKTLPSSLFKTEEDALSPTTVNYRKSDAVSYEVNIKNATSAPFKLIFKETYNDLWEARINGEKINDHFVAYDYANGWKIQKEGDYLIKIVFKVWPWD